MNVTCSNILKQPQPCSFYYWKVDMYVFEAHWHHKDEFIVGWERSHAVNRETLTEALKQKSMLLIGHQVVQW